jgi:hypothetical protein
MCVSNVAAAPDRLRLTWVVREYLDQEKPEIELKRLRMEQNKSRRDEVFGGFSPTQRMEYEAKSERIHALESKFKLNIRYWIP